MFMIYIIILYDFKININNKILVKEALVTFWPAC